MIPAYGIGIPYSLSSPVLYINRDLLKEAGLSKGDRKPGKRLIPLPELFRKDLENMVSICPGISELLGALEDSSRYAAMLTRPQIARSGKLRKPEGIQAMDDFVSSRTEPLSMFPGMKAARASLIATAQCSTTICRRASVQKRAVRCHTVKSPTWGPWPRKGWPSGCFLSYHRTDR